MYLTGSRLSHLLVRVQRTSSNWPRQDFWRWSKDIMPTELLTLSIRNLLPQLDVGFTLQCSTELSLLCHLRQCCGFLGRYALFLPKGDMTNSSKRLLVPQACSKSIHSLLNLQTAKGTQHYPVGNDIPGTSVIPFCYMKRGLLQILMHHSLHWQQICHFQWSPLACGQNKAS